MMSFIQFSKRKLKKRRKLIIKIMLWSFSFIIILILISVLLNKKIDEGVDYIPNKSVIVDGNFESDIYFNDTDGFDKYHGVIIDALREAEETIQIAIYSIWDDTVVDVLEQKRKDGVDVEIVVPRSKESQHNKVFANIDLKPISVVGGLSNKNDVDELMHHKFILIDRGFENQQLLFGSSNLTYLQQKYDPSFLIATSDSELIDVFGKEFDLLKDGIYGFRKLSTGKFKPLAFKGQYNNGYVEIWFSPGYMKNSVKGKIIELIDEAESSIKIIGWRINDVDIYKSLLKKSREGISIKIILGDYYMWSEFSIAKRLKKDGGRMEIFSDSYRNIAFEKEGLVGIDFDADFNSYIHHHSLIVDDNTLVSGTNNWGRGGFYYNDESIIVTNINELVNSYVDQFEHFYKTLNGDSIDLKINSENILEIDSNLKEWTEIIFYTEKSDPDTGDICFKVNRKEFELNKTIPKECNNDQARVFIIDEEGDLLYSDYLNYNNPK